MRLTIIAAALAASSLSVAFSPAFAKSLSELGVDITAAGNTPAEVQTWLAALKPDTKKAVLDGCATYLNDQTDVEEQTITFCKLAVPQ
jgi:ABC-type molybdate transport system permease subunit